MRSSVIRHFPQIRFRGREKQLWNPVLKKRYKDLPEERVRLALVDYLHLECGHSLNRLSFESPAGLPGEINRARTDLICYDEQFHPHLLVECKAPEIPLSEKVLHQIARYNQQIEAPFLLITNGSTDLYVDLRSGSPELSMDPPELAQPILKPERVADYWTDRGFIGQASDPFLKSWLPQSLTDLYLTDPAPRPYLSLREHMDPDQLLSWYQIVEQADHAVAVSVAANADQHTILTLILNEEGRNTAFLRSDLDKVITGEADNTTIWLPDTDVTIDLGKHHPLKESDSLFEVIADLTNAIKQIRKS